MIAARHLRCIRRAGITGLMMMLALGLGGCSRHDEAAVRSLLERWFSLGDTVSFVSNRQCTAGLFKVQTDQAKSALRVEPDAESALREYRRSGVIAIDDPALSPDEAFKAVMNAERAVGVHVQAALLGGKPCMDDNAESAFFYALSNPAALLVYIGDEGAVAMLDPRTRLVIFSGGGG